MKISFICGSTEATKDGVGDYTKRIREELERSGHSTQSIALNDSYANKFVQIGFDARCPSTAEIKSRFDFARKALQGFSPDWVSLQLVPFAFNRKGYLKKSIRPIDELRNRFNCPWHLMIHELWIGLSTTDALINRFIGWQQKRQYIKFLHALSANKLHTSNKGYQSILNKNGFESSILPIPSNIPISSPEFINKDNLLKEIEDSVNTKLPQNPLIALSFGSVHPHWNAAECASILKKRAHEIDREIIFIFTGRTGPHIYPTLDSINSQNNQDTCAFSLGALDSARISELMQIADVGFLSTPWQLMDKSGSFAAMRDHGLPVLASRSDWIIKGLHQNTPSPGIYKLEDMDTIGFKKLLERKRAPKDSISSIATTFLASLK